MGDSVNVLLGGLSKEDIPASGQAAQRELPASTAPPTPTRSRTRTHTHPLARGRPPALPLPLRSRAEFPPLLIVRGPAPAQPPPRPAPLRLAGALLGEGAEAGADGTGRESPQPPAEQQTLRHRPDAAAAAPLPLALRPNPALRQGGGAADSRVPGHRQALGATARPSRAAPTFQTHRPCANPAATCFGPGGEGTMRSALALSALLLLLLLPPPSLSQNDTAGKDGSPPAAPATTVKTSTVSGAKLQTSGAISDSATSTKSYTTDSSASTSRGSSLNPTQPSTPAVTTASTTVSVTRSGSTMSSSPTLTNIEKATSQSTDKGTAVPGDSSSGHIPTATTATQRTEVPSSLPSGSITTINSPVASPGSPGSHHPTTVTVKTPESSTSGQHSLSSVPSGSSPAPGTSSPTSKVLPTTQTSSVSTIAPQKEPPQCTPEGTQQTSSQMPPKPTPSSSMTSPLEGSSSHPSSRTGATSTVGGYTHSSTRSASVAPQGLSTTSSTLAPGKPKVDCMPPERLDKKLLILNLTETSPCAKSPPADDKLITQLCQAVKATFNPAQDSCTVQLAPIQESQAVALKKITIQTNLLPENVYALLKDKWDDLREVGVSHMQLGDEGPPEEAEDRFSMPLIITIVCMASFLLLVAALYGCCHQRLSQRKDQQRLTEELQTVENGYHDNPTLEVMETSSEMQEKKVVNLNGELGDSWIVPLDNLTKDDLDEEDTHL
uniref:podocalyxin n=1 Tax=Callospermophilus lateralis TaxID=76772 RepID=UPI0040385220